ncbi:alpha/beta hydrolase [Kaistella palustris]|uniref:alpha/beta hydrolase n=1 Tax=Kaistella palustris TaxID=493376 RepID=UPI00040EAB61|nr:alpha/beta hydrolase [Kaistella palustris]
MEKPATYSLKKKLYVISGLGADFKVLNRIDFPENLEVVFIDWLMPLRGEDFHDYVNRMAEKVDDSQPFYLLGYSFGGIMVQEINRIKPAEKVVIMGSIKSHKEKSRFLKWGEVTRIPRFLPQTLYNPKSAVTYAFLRRIFDPRNPKLMDYFTVRDTYYLKWSVEKIADWKFEENPEVIQILGSRDVIFPLKFSKPDYVVEGGTHLFPATKHREVSRILREIFS